MGGGSNGVKSLTSSGTGESRLHSLDRSRFLLLLPVSLVLAGISVSSATFGCLLGVVEALELVF